MELFPSIDVEFLMLMDINGEELIQDVFEVPSNIYFHMARTLLDTMMDVNELSKDRLAIKEPVG